MNEQRRFRMRKILSIVPKISFLNKLRTSTDSNGTVQSTVDASDPESSGTNNCGAKSKVVSLDSSLREKSMSGELTGCRPVAILEDKPVHSNNRNRRTSVSSGLTATPSGARRGSTHGSHLVKDEKSSYSDEIELTEEQKAELKQAFAMFEKAGKGRIPARDLGELLRCLGWNPSEQDLEEARHELELTTRGSLSFSEVEGYIARRGGIYYGNNAEEDIMVAFQVLDKNGTGRITVPDFRHFLTTMGERMSHEEAEELIARTTQDGKDYIEYRDLVLAVQHLPT